MQGRTSTVSPRTAASPLARSAEPLSGGGSKRDRQRTIREVVTTEAIGSQQELADRLIARGFAVTQATVSRDIGELGLVKVPRAEGHVYVVPESLGTSATPASDPAAAGTGAAPASDERLRRILVDIPVTMGRSGLTLLITGSPGTASVIAQAIDESSLSEQEGTLAGDNTLLVLFADEGRLLHWQARFDTIRSTVEPAAAGRA